LLTLKNSCNDVYIWKEAKLGYFQRYTLMESSDLAKRKMNPKSLENLKAGAVARNLGKIRCQVTILPETKEWLALGGNVSGRVDEMVTKILKGELVGASKLEELQREVTRLEAELKRLRP
jgi:hypothetical protein